MFSPLHHFVAVLPVLSSIVSLLFLTCFLFSPPSLHFSPLLSPPQPLDYESVVFHTLLIKVENEDPLVPDVGYGSSSTATVHITVLDVNEGPVFFPDPLQVTKMENIALGSFVALLNATDPDVLQSQSIR